MTILEQLTPLAAHYRYDKPFVVGPWAVVTDGYWALGVANDGSVTHEHDAGVAQVVARYFEENSMIAIPRDRFLGWIGEYRCDRCDNKGRVTCDRCDGGGEDETPCHHCGRSEPVTCQECGGERMLACSCRSTRDEAAVGCAVLDRRFFRTCAWAFTGGEVRVGVKAPEEAVLFAGDGWRFAVMPVRAEGTREPQLLVGDEAGGRDA